MPTNKRVLVVDDNEEFCQNLSDILESRGYEASTAHDGFKAIELVKQKGFDLVLMDVKMPKMDGVETFKRVKNISPQTAVVMVSAFSVDNLIRDALREGAFSYLRKPIDFDRLFAIIESAVFKGALILVVDDDTDLCASLSDALSGKRYLVCLAYDGNTATQRVKEKDYDVILLDMKMPMLNGFETYLAVRDIRPNAVAVIVTGYRHEMSGLIKQALEHSAYACLDKPVDMDKLVSLLDRIREQKNKATK
ncbi:MAG: response regulator [Chloroflexi bacterium]|nr:response regulator [Chloroflexota bacterium]